MIVLIIIAMAILSIQIAYDSSLAQEVKETIFPIKYIEAFSKISFWNKLLSKYLFPINLTFAILFSIYKKISEALQCSRCTSFWLGSIGVYLTGVNPVESILYGLITILIVIVIERVDV